MLLPLFLFIVGIALLVICSDKMVESAERIASHLGISEFIIGLTVIAFSTSLPELITGLLSAVKGIPIVALGNAIGSNIANIGLILGMTGLAGAAGMHKNKLHLNQAGILVFISCLLAILLIDGNLSQGDSFTLLGALGVYFWFLVTKAEYQIEHNKKPTNIAKAGKAHTSVSRHFVFVLIAAFGLWIGANWVVDGVLAFANFFGIGEGIIALTAVALGTSLPEMTVAVQAMLQKHAELSMGDVLGANAMNILLNLGLVSFITPVSTTGRMFFMVAIMAFFSLLLWIFLRTSNKITRFEGLIFVLGYVFTLVFIGWTA